MDKQKTMENAGALVQECTEKLKALGYESFVLAINMDLMTCVESLKMNEDSLRFSFFKMLTDIGDKNLALNLAQSAVAAHAKMSDDQGADREIKKMLDDLNLN